MARRVKLRLGAKVQKLLDHYSWSQSELARRTRGVVNQPVISSIIVNGTMPGANRVFALARALGVSADWLLDDSQNWPPPQLGQWPPGRLAS